MKLVFANPSKPSHSFLSELQKTISGQEINEIRAGYAYVSYKGARLLMETLSRASLQKSEMCFVAGINEGITEPRALDFLMNQVGVRLRVFLPNRRLQRDSLFLKPTFHPKVLHVSMGRLARKEVLSVSSANLTLGAIGPHPKNYEAGCLFDLSGNPLEMKSFLGWWGDFWEISREVDKKFISQYAQIRGEVLNNNPDLLSLCEPSDEISTAQHFWIQVGKASGMDRHQIEFPMHLASFFGVPQKKRVDLTIIQGGRRFEGRPLSHKKTSFGVDIWRLGMPTVKSGGEAIQNRVVQFTRTSSADLFECEVTDQGSNAMSVWFDSCNKFGHLGRTSGANSRMYGYL